MPCASCREVIVAKARSLRPCPTADNEVVCEVLAGDAVIMCPLLLHASSPMTSGERRRVIHLEFADFALPAPLEWQHGQAADRLRAAAT